MTTCALLPVILTIIAPTAAVAGVAARQPRLPAAGRHFGTAPAGFQLAFNARATKPQVPGFSAMAR